MHNHVQNSPSYLVCMVVQILSKFTLSGVAGGSRLVPNSTASSLCQHVSPLHLLHHPVCETSEDMPHSASDLDACSIERHGLALRAAVVAVGVAHLGRPQRRRRHFYRVVSREGFRAHAEWHHCALRGLCDACDAPRPKATLLRREGWQRGSHGGGGISLATARAAAQQRT